MGVHFPSRYLDTTMVGARTVPNAGRAGAAGVGAALRDAAAAPEGGVIVIFRSLLPRVSYQRVGSVGRCPRNERTRNDSDRGSQSTHFHQAVSAGSPR